jgi:hypothetical protein
MTVTVNMRGIDFAFMPDPNGYAGIAGNGAGFVSRYSAGVGGAANSKCTKANEIADAAGQGVDFLANFELKESTPEEGAASGRNHGAADGDFWAARGLAATAGVAVSWEPGSDSSKFGAVADFLTGFRATLGRPVGMYSSLPALLFMRQRQLIDFTWLSMSSSASGFNWGPISQADYAARMLRLAQDNGLNMVQNRNRWYPKGQDTNGNTIFGADEDIVVNLPAGAWSHLQAAGGAVPIAGGAAGGAVGRAVGGAVGGKVWQGEPWPGFRLGFGAGDHFGNINGPAQSHGGATAGERSEVTKIQQRLIACGFVPGHSNPNDGWADGIFDIRGNGQLGGPTTDAVVRFQAACRPGSLTSKPGEFWSDDWATLFNLP